MATHTKNAAPVNPASYDPLLAAIARYTLAPVPRDARDFMGLLAS